MRTKKQIYLKIPFITNLIDQDKKRKALPKEYIII